MINTIKTVLQDLDIPMEGTASTDVAQKATQNTPFFEYRNVMRIFCPSQIPKALEISNVILWNAGTAKEKIDELVAFLPNYQIVGISDLSPKLAENKNGALSSSLNFHPPHLDGVYRNRLFDLVALQNVQVDSTGGGYGLFWNMAELLYSMPREYYDFLKKNVVKYARLKNDASGYETYEGSMIHLNDDNNEVIRWRFDTQVRPELVNTDKENQQLFEKICAWVLNFLCTQLPDVVPYQEGDFVLMKNSVFHGRTMLTSSERYVRRIWFDKK